MAKIHILEYTSITDQLQILYTPMQYLFYAIFATLLLIAIICQIVLYVVNRRLSAIEARIIDRYHSKIDKIPAILCVLQKHSTKMNEYNDLTLLHRSAIIGAASNIYHVLESNARISDRFGFLMRLALAIKSTTKDGNFITIRESITSIE
jgi:hypothetical protein